MDRDDDIDGLNLDLLLEDSRQLRHKADAARRGLAEVVQRIQASKAVAQRLRAESAALRARQAVDPALAGPHRTGHVPEQVALLYVSRAAPSLSVDRLASLARVARLRNLDDGITSLLAFDGASFLQMVEGPAHAIVDLEQRLRRDRRHTDIDVLSLAPAKATPRFPRWQLGFLDLAGGGIGIEALRGARGDEALSRFDDILPALDPLLGTAMPA